MKYSASPLCLCFVLALEAISTHGFVSPNTRTGVLSGFTTARAQLSPPSTTALNVWWFGGTESSEPTGADDDSCELVAVRIEKTSANSRKIAGEITVPTRLLDVWAILTDYNRLTTHIPNLTESKIVGRPQILGEPGDGNYRCKLYQVGAQKIVGFDFSASVTMDMTEKIQKARPQRRLLPVSKKVINSEDDGLEMQEPMLMDDRVIGFKCADSFFFKEFDGEWKLREQYTQDGQFETVVSYVVDVRPKGPVPVAALEWRIREDVPANLRAVKKAAVTVGQSIAEERALAATPAVAAALPSSSVGVKNILNNANNVKRISTTRVNNAMKRAFSKRQQQNLRVAPVTVAPSAAQWDRDETMAAYLTDS